MCSILPCLPTYLPWIFVLNWVVIIIAYLYTHIIKIVCTQFELHSINESQILYAQVFLRSSRRKWDSLSHKPWPSVFLRCWIADARHVFFCICFCKFFAIFFFASFLQLFLLRLLGCISHAVIPRFYSSRPSPVVLIFGTHGISGNATPDWENSLSEWMRNCQVRLRVFSLSPKDDNQWYLVSFSDVGFRESEGFFL